MDRISILIVEDEFIVAKDLQTNLERLGYTVCGRVNSGEKAINHVEQTPTDMVLMDIMLKGAMTGIEAAGEIRERFHVPVMYVTANTNPSIVEHAKTTEPFGFIVKPFSERELHANIEMALYKHRAEEQLRASEKELRLYKNHLEELVEQRTTALQQEISERIQLEEQLLQSQKMEAVGQLAGGIAHDFNTLLGIILGHGDLMRDDLLEESPLRDSLEEIIEAGYRAKTLVRQLLDFARPSRLDRQQIWLAPIVEDSARLLRSSLPAHIGIRQRIETESGDVLVDSTQIAQIIMNLGMNAADAIGGQEGEIEIALEHVDVSTELAGLQKARQGAYVRLSVSDTGCGMNHDVLTHMLEPFFTTKEVGKGTGLGLSIVHGIVKSHDGFITVESEPGKGSSFQVYLPKHQPQ